MPFFHFWFEMRGTPVRTGGVQTAMLWAPRHWGIMWSLTPFESIETDKATSARMPNTWSDTRVCFGSNPVRANQSLGSYVDALINTYWTSEFNTDLDVFTPVRQDWLDGTDSYFHNE